MANIKVAVVNASTVLTDDQVKAAVPVLQTQVHRDFAPIWGIDADLTFVPNGSNPDPNAWVLGIFDNSDVADALGYHDVTPQGLPLGKVFAGSDIKDGLQWSVTASHELLEMLADPEINLTVFDQPSPHKGILYAYEVCDACEADQYAYQIEDISVSDFVYPSWFEISLQDVQYDHGNYLKKPLPDLLPGGYIGAFDVKSGSGWHQITAERTAKGMRTLRHRVGSRRERRNIPRSDWLKSKF